MRARNKGREAATTYIPGGVSLGLWNYWLGGFNFSGIMRELVSTGKRRSETEAHQTCHWPEKGR